jgi:hypothetical protein
MPCRLLAAIALLALAVAAPAGAVDDAKPTPTCAPFNKDSGTDAVEPTPDRPAADNMELLGAFFKHDPAKGADATTINMVVKDLSTKLPPGDTSINWSLEWKLGEKIYFVRAVADFSSTTVFEWGERIPETAAGALPRYQYSGDTKGKLFEGKDGVVELVIPADIGGKAGSSLSAMKASANAGRSVVPVGAKTPTRGVANANDEIAVKNYVVGACDGATAAPPAVNAPAPSPGPGGTKSEDAGKAPLPVKLVTTKARSSKRLALKLSSSEKVTNLVAQLRRGRKVAARGRLAVVDGPGTLKLKFSKKLRKGTYTLDLAGDDAAGRHRLTAARLIVR